MAEGPPHVPGTSCPNEEARLQDGVVHPIRLGSLLAEMGREAQLTDEEVAGFQREDAAVTAALGSPSPDRGKY